jgi:hypothetical protein
MIESPHLLTASRHPAAHYAAAPRIRTPALPMGDPVTNVMAP